MAGFRCVGPSPRPSALTLPPGWCDRGVSFRDFAFALENTGSALESVATISHNGGWRAPRRGGDAGSKGGGPARPSDRVNRQWWRRVSRNAGPGCPTELWWALFSEGGRRDGRTGTSMAWDLCRFVDSGVHFGPAGRHRQEGPLGLFRRRRLLRSDLLVSRADRAALQPGRPGVQRPDSYRLGRHDRVQRRRQGQRRHGQQLRCERFLPGDPRLVRSAFRQELLRSRHRASRWCGLWQSRQFLRAPRRLPGRDRGLQGRGRRPGHGERRYHVLRPRHQQE